MSSRFIVHFMFTCKKTMPYGDSALLVACGTAFIYEGFVIWMRCVVRMCSVAIACSESARGMHAAASVYLTLPCVHTHCRACSAYMEEPHINPTRIMT